MYKEEKDIRHKLRTVFARTVSVLLLLMVTVVLAAPDFAFAKETEKTEKEEPIREVHNVGVGNELYCFFVTHNVVLTPAEVEGMTDEELTAAILERAGLYMKKANCKKAAHKEITIKTWTKKKGRLLLSNADIEGIRMAEPVDGEPVKFYMDLDMTLYSEEKEADPEPEEEAGDAEGEEDPDAGEGEEEEEVITAPRYSTFKRTSPRLLFAVVATEEDAKYGEDICIEDKKPDQKKPKTKTKTKIPDVGKTEAPAEEMLPEYRTINMADRSGAPIEETLKDGDPVTLEWIEPKDIGKDEEASFFDRIPGGAAGFTAMAAAVAAAAGAIIIAARRKREDD